VFFFFFFTEKEMILRLQIYQAKVHLFNPITTL